MSGNSVRESRLGSEVFFFFEILTEKNSVSLSSAVSAAAAVLDTLHTLGQMCHTQGPQAGPNTQRHRKQLARVIGVRLSSSLCNVSINAVSPTMHFDSGTQWNNKFKNHS